MKPIPLPIAELKNALTGLGKVIPKRMTLPVLAAVKIERTSEGWVALTATDLDHFATVRLEQPTDGEAATVILPYDELLKTSKVCGKNDTVLVQSDGKHAPTSGTITYAVGGQVVDHRCTSIDPVEFPSIPRFKGEAIPLPDALRSSLLEAFQCASEDVTRYVVTGAYVDVSREDGHYVVGTNGRILYSSNSFKLPIKESLNIPPHKFVGWKEFTNDGAWQLKIGLPTKRKDQDDEPAPIQITSRRWRFISRQIEGNYPNWRQVVPGDSAFDTRVEIDPAAADKLVQTIERMPCHNTSHMTMGVQVIRKTVALLGKAPGADQWTRVEIETAAVTGPDVTILLDRRHVTMALKFGLTRIEFSDAMAPVRFSHDGRQLIVMPIRPDTVPAQTPAAPAETPNAQDASNPVASDAHQPAAENPAAQPEKMNMATTTTTTTPAASNGNGQHSPETAETKGPLELALDQIETIKGSYREAVRGLNGLAETLKQAQREQKTSTKEIQSVRQTLRSLQSVRI